MAAQTGLFRSLASQVLLRVVPPLLLLMVAIGWVVLQLNQQALQRQIEQRLEQQLASGEALFDEALYALREQARGLAGNDLVWNGLIDTEERYRYLPALFRSLRGVAWGEAQARFALLDFRGRVVISNEIDGYAGEIFADELPWSARLREEVEVVRLDRHGLLLLMPVRIHGFVEGWLELSVASAELGSLLRGWRSLDSSVALLDAAPQPLLVSGGGCGARAAEGCLTLQRPLEGLDGLSLRVGLPRAQVVQERTELAMQLFWLMLLTLLVVLAGVVLATRLTARPLARLAAAADAIAGSPDLATRLPEQGPREVRHLTRAINRSLDQLEASHVSRSDLEASEAKYRALVENAPIILYRCELQSPWRMLHISQGAEHLCGYLSRHLLDGELHWAGLIVEEDLPVVEAAVANGVAAGRRYEVEYRIRHADGSLRWLHEIGQEQRGDGASWLEGVITDVSERKEAELRLQQIAENINEVVWIRTPGQMLYISPSYERVWGRTVQSLLEAPNSFIEAIHPEDRAQVIAALQAEFEEGRFFDMSYRIVRPDGAVRWIHARSYPVRDEHGVLYRSAGTAVDITDGKALEEELARSNAELEQFAYAVSHDMRQPLRMVSGHLQILERMLVDLDEDALASLRYAVDGARRMDQMIIALLDYSRVGRKGAPMALLASRESVDEALIFLAPALDEAQAVVEVGGEWPPLCASRDELTRLLQNLIGNAVKYVEPGGVPRIAVNASVDAGVWRVEVVDNGIGIPEGQAERLFQVFSRLHKGGGYEGSGVGLALCRKIVEHHGGRIGVESAGTGQGSTFWFELPLRGGGC